MFTTGDVMLAHPFLLHARSKNFGQLAIESVRFMCHPAVPLRAPMQVGRDNSAGGKNAPTPVETAIVNVRPEEPPTQEAQESALEEARMLKTMGFGSFRNAKRQKRGYR